jgi:hypothetical protein
LFYSPRPEGDGGEGELPAHFRQAVLVHQQD